MQLIGSDVTKFIAPSFLGTLLLLTPSTVFASVIVQWQYEGVFTTVPSEYRDAGLFEGDTFLGGLRLDIQSQDQSAESGRGSYGIESSFIHVPALNAFWEFSGTETGRLLTVLNDIPPGFDFFEVYQRDTPINDPSDPTMLVFFNGRAPTDLFDSESLPLIPPNVDAFEFLTLQYTDYRFNSSSQGIVTSLFAVNEPPTFLLIGTALLFLLMRPRGEQRIPSRSPPTDDRACFAIASGITRQFGDL